MNYIEVMKQSAERVEPVAMTEELAVLLSSINGDCYLGKEKEEELVYVVRRQYTTPPAVQRPVAEPHKKQEMKAKGHTDFSVNVYGKYINPSLQQRWAYFAMGWEMKEVTA